MGITLKSDRMMVEKAKELGIDLDERYELRNNDGRYGD